MFRNLAVSSNSSGCQSELSCILLSDYSVLPNSHLIMSLWMRCTIFQWKSLTGVPQNKNKGFVNIVSFADSSDNLSASFTSMMVLPPLQNIVLSSWQQVQLLATDVELNWNSAKRIRADVNAIMWSLNIASGQSHFKGLKEHDSDSIYRSILPGTFCNVLGDNWCRRRRVYRQRSRPLLSREIELWSVLWFFSTACQHPASVQKLGATWPFLHFTGEMCETWTSSFLPTSPWCTGNVRHTIRTKFFGLFLVRSDV